ncbi:hypothetical protein L2744_18740 [Shewanella profunda]|uniref:hypothetical protein n=1 Tax=Shewanella profunda TaxID=254793 RepID=UPI00200D51BA|nr:hypothetical protein [Shewanella profunda]MCL1091599.1 hypothetical protein [Shewanella profunda]
MKTNVCFVESSFNFNGTENDLIQSFYSAALLVSKMNSEYVTFTASSDFHEFVATELYCSGKFIEIGALTSAIYDGGMSKVKIYDNFNSNDVLSCASKKVPVHEDCWLSLYSSSNEAQVAPKQCRIINSENDLVSYCSEVLIKNPVNHNEYAKIFPLIYRNILFLNNTNTGETYDSIRKLNGGYQNYICGITSCLIFMNGYQVIPNDWVNNIANLNTALEFPVTPEGTGSNQRQIGELKRDFLINDIEYKNINCEYHYKLERIDGANGKGTYYFNRIYFGFFNRIKCQNPQIAIAHIGEHL